MANVDTTELIYCIALLSVAFTCDFVWGHTGLKIVLCIGIGWELLWDALQINRYRLQQPLKPYNIGGTTGDPLPIHWYIGTVAIFSFAFLFQIVLDYTIVSGLLVCFACGAVIVHRLRFFSGTYKENALTLLSTWALLLVMVLTLFSASGTGLMGYSTWGGFLRLFCSLIVGMMFGMVYLSLLGYGDAQEEERRRLNVDKSNEPTPTNTPTHSIRSTRSSRSTDRTHHIPSSSTSGLSESRQKRRKQGSVEKISFEEEAKDKDKAKPDLNPFGMDVAEP